MNKLLLMAAILTLTALGVARPDAAQAAPAGACAGADSSTAAPAT